MGIEENWRLEGLAAERWEWLKEQPQDAWLLFIRTANWDESDGIFLEMLADSECDCAIAAFIFWFSEPDYALYRGNYGYSELVQLVVENYERGYYRKAELHQDRYALARQADSYQSVLKQGEASDLFRLPRALCGPFGSRKARIENPGEDFLDRLELSLGGDIFLSEEEYDRYEVKGNYGHWRDYYQLPEMGADFEAQNQGLSDAEYLAAAFGPPKLRLDAYSAFKAAQEKAGRT